MSRQRRPFLEQHPEGEGLRGVLRRLSRRTDRLERAPRSGNVTIQRVRVVGSGGGGGITDHGDLSGLLDDDHTQYLETDELFAVASPQTLTAGSAISVTDGVPVTPIDSASAITLTSQPTIAAGRTGQLVALANVGSYNIILQDVNALGGSLLRLTANTVTIQPGGTLILRYDSTVGFWMEVSLLNPQTFTPSISGFTIDGSSADTREVAAAATADAVPAFVLTYVGTPSACSIDIDAGSQAQRVGASADDCRRSVNAAYFDTNNADLNVGDEGASYIDWSSGFRFQNMQIPNGATVSSAIITFTAQSTISAGTCRLILKGEAADNAAAFSTAGNYDGRTRTTASVTWTAPAMTAGQTYNSPDISAVIQEIVNRVGWAAGNSLVIFVEDNASDTGAFRRLKSYDGAAASAALLTVSASGMSGEISGSDYPISVPSPYTSLNSGTTPPSKAFHKGAYVGQVRSFTATATVAGQAGKTRQCTATYINRRYMGPSTQTATLTSPQVLGLGGAGGTSGLSTSRTGTFGSITIGASEYLWYAYRAGLGTGGLYLAINSEVAAFSEKQTALSHTNDSGFIENFVTWRSGNANLGSGLTAVVETSPGTNRIYMGPATDTDPISNASILALDDTADGESWLSSTVAGTYTAIKIEAGEYLWFCHPSRVSDLSTIKDQATGFGIAGSYRTNVTHTNQYGYQETYRCWRSDNTNIFPSGTNVVVT